MKAASLVFFLTLACPLAFPADPAGDPYRLSIPAQEARQTFNEILEDLRLHPNSSSHGELDAAAEKLFRSFRFSSSARALPIAEGPFLGLLIQGKGAEIFASQYEENWKKQYQTNVADPTPEVLFDDFMQVIISGKSKDLPPDFQKISDQIGACLAGKVERGKVDSKGKACDLDNDEAHSDPEPGTLKEAIAKLSCNADWLVDPCNARKTIFYAAKPKLVALKKDVKAWSAVRDVLDKQFGILFPTAFRDAFLGGMNELKTKLPEMISKKFGGTPNSPYWSDTVSLVESDPSSGDLKLRDFLSGMNADLGMASLLDSSQDPATRGGVAALFYGVANRLLLISGGTQALWDSKDKKWALSPGDHFSADRPSRPPVFAQASFGGWGAEMGDSGPRMSSWDLSGYHPAASENPTPLRLFPGEFQVQDGLGGNAKLQAGKAPEETLGELADLISASARFLKATRPDAEFGKYFGDAAALRAGLSDPNNPVLFPKEGRLLAVGVLAAALKNLIAPKVGHLELVDPGSPGAGLGLVFHDRITLSGRDPSGTRTARVARLLLAAAELREALQGDPDIPSELLALAPKLDGALQAGSWELSGVDAQNGDGGFYEVIHDPTTQNRTLETNIAVLRLLTRVYSNGLNRYPVMLLSIESAWKFLDHFWGAGKLPGQSLDPVLAWRMLHLWDETQGAVRADMEALSKARKGGETLDWAKWGRRFDDIREALMDQLRTEEGPSPIAGLSS